MGTAIGVSKPDFGRDERRTFIWPPAVAAPSTRQAVACVAPFQLAYTVVVEPVRSAAPAGLVSGSPTH